MEDYNHLDDPLRKGRVTASVVGAILGNNPYMTRDDVMRAMVRDHFGAEREFAGNIATEYGKANEPNAILDFQMETGLKVEKGRFVSREDWAGCSPDGICSDGAGLETKCPFGLRKAEAPVPFKSLSEQPHYHDQVQFSLWVTERGGWYFAQWTPNGFTYDPVAPSQEWQDHALPILRQFHAEFLDILADEDSAAEYLAPKRVVIDTPEAARMVREWDELTEQAERVKERKADLLADMVNMAGGKNAEIAGRKLTLTEKAGSISYAKAIKELLPKADLEKWRGKPSKYWGLR